MSFILQTYRGKNDWWRWMLILAILLYPYFFRFYEYLYQYDEQLENFHALKSFSGDKAEVILTSILKYILYLAILLAGVKFIHKRDVTTIFNTQNTIRYKRIFFSFCCFGLLICLVTFAEYLVYPKDFVFQFHKETFLKLFVVVFFLSPIKVFFQEAFFRGYLLQCFAISFKSKWLAVLFVSLLFGGFFSLHAQSDFFEFNLLFYYIVADILLGIIVLMDDGIELAIGIGWFSNVFSYLLLTNEWMAFKTDSLFFNTSSEPDYLFLMYLPLFLVFPLCIFIFNKVYKWSDFKNKIFKEVK